MPRSTDPLGYRLTVPDRLRVHALRAHDQGFPLTWRQLAAKLGHHPSDITRAISRTTAHLTARDPFHEPTPPPPFNPHLPRQDLARIWGRYLPSTANPRFRATLAPRWQYPPHNPFREVRSGGWPHSDPAYRAALAAERAAYRHFITTTLPVPTRPVQIRRLEPLYLSDST